MRSTLIRFSKGTQISTRTSSHVDKDSFYEKFSCFSAAQHVNGIWRAPRKLGFTKEEFDRAYPESYRSMRIGLPDSGTFAAKYIDPRFDEVSPLIWTAIITSPLIIWGLVELKHIYYPSEKKAHH
ncbi:hypothetical protein BEWA_021660 [Theileria equi strain WA]|uniref:Uncharacterized protein n=1 Tax=Theileria equi strain WA TaxID=1537102 RepID=L0AVP9_THEEQ|nr:hypothetical protein BEWA_021660 [Theileria equi strain WA]AFZ79318.1 hypothetical protein BEWA_021660 [Theileria equi strain WA]|eukprot:XP_004828984.1 hypothetical protein BEWA_021660 [Theileria equi strain WA]